MSRVAFVVRLAPTMAVAAMLGGCSSIFGVWKETDERKCLARAMYFESNRSSDEGMLAVGTVVMNRRESGRYPRTICGVVGQPRQFAPGVLTAPMDGKGADRALRNADRVLAGARHPNLNGVHFFHTAGYQYPYSNMQYRIVAGGNAFYEKRKLQPGEVQTTQADIAAWQSAQPPAPPQRPVVAEAPSLDPAESFGEEAPSLDPAESFGEPGAEPAQTEIAIGLLY